MNKELSEDRLRAHVWQLAAEIGERNVFHPAALHAAEEYVRAVWRDQGYHVHVQECIASGVPSANLEVIRPGRGQKD